MVQSFTEGNHAGDFIISEANDYISRTKVMIAEGQNLAAGTVVGLVTADTAYAMYDNGAGDGTNQARGILYAAVDASDGEVEGVLIARTAEVNGHCLVWESGISDNDKAAAEADLLALGISVRY